MNTKGIKFLAVLAVMVMAFAAVIVLAPADKDVVAIDVCDESKVIRDPTVILGNEDVSVFYISDDATVKIKALPNGFAIFLVQNGKELELSIKGEVDDSFIEIYTVTSDQQRHTTSTIDVADEEREQRGEVDGKIVIADTVLAFAPVKGQTVIYKALMPYEVDTHTTSGDGIEFATHVWTYNKDGSKTTSQRYATISSDKELINPMIGEYVTVASGQFVDVYTDEDYLELIEMKYGIMVTNASATEATLYTYYATGYNAGTFYVDDVDDAVDIKNGTITVNNGSTAKAVSAKGVKITNTSSDKIVVKGSMTAGTLTVTGTANFSNFKIGTDATATIANNTTAKGTIEVNGLLNLKNAAEGIQQLTVNSKEGEQATGIISAQNEKLWDYTEGTTPKLTFAGGTFCGLYDVSAITKSAEVKDAFSTAVINRNQTFVVVADTVVTTELDVQGVLIINPGVTLTISKIAGIGAAVTLTGQYAQIINNGDIIIKTTHPAEPTTNPDTSEEIASVSGLHINGGLAVNNGRIIASSDAATLEVDEPTATLCVDFPANDPKGIGFINNGPITASKNDIIAFDSYFENGKEGSLVINGTFEASEFTNKGAFTLNNAKIDANLTINTKGGATVNIVAAEITGAYFISVVDDGTATDANVKVTASDEIVVRGIMIQDISTSKYGMFDVSGSMGTTLKTGHSSAYATLTMSGDIYVANNAIVGDRYKLDIDDAGLYVMGTLSIPKLADGITGEEASAATIWYVSGIINDADGRLDGQYLSARYTLTGTGTTAVIYSSLEDAVAAAKLAGVNSIDVGYYGTTVADSYFPTVTESFTVPAGMFINGLGLNVGDEDNAPVIVIESSAGFSFTSINLVDGIIIAENANDITESSVHADVKELDSTAYSLTFKSLDAALALSSAGDVIVLNQDIERISKDLVIPEGVTVDATSAENGPYNFVVIDSNLVVNGMLVVDQFAFVATTDDTKAITLNGTIMDACDNGECISPWWYVPAGVSYQLTLEDEYGTEETWYVITSIDNLQAAIIIADESKVAIEGNPKLGDVTIVGTEDEPAEVTFKGDINAGTITLDNAIIIGKDGNKVTATFADALGSITITGAYVDRALSIYSLNDEGVFMAGAVTDAPNGTYSIRFDGITGMDGTSRAVIGWGKYVDVIGEDEEEEPIYATVATPTILFNGTTTAIGKKATIENTEDIEVVYEGIVTITGSLIADNNTKIVMNSDVQVLGALIAKERLGSANGGNIEIAGNLFVGTLMSDIYDVEAAIKVSEVNLIGNFSDHGFGKSVKDTGEAAVIAGKISLADDTYIIIIPGSDVDLSIIEDLEYLDVYIGDTLWITVYGTDTYCLDGLTPYIINAKSYGVYDEEYNSVASYSHAYGVIYGSKTLKMADYDAVYVALDYEVFTIKIKTDGSVKAVYIDGILMETGDSENIFYLNKQVTGTHKVTVEAATGYDASKCVLYTEMGTILPGMAFTFTEFDCDNYVVTYNINGTEIQPEPVPPTPEEESQWTITTILLVILVVLIAIMAVIVALRLNRS